jgi:hypothetical protein
MKPVALAFLLLALAGCQTAEQKLAAAEPGDDAQCREMGYKPGTALYLQCRELKVRTHLSAYQEDRARARQRAQALSALGETLQRAGGSDSLSTTCSQFGSSIDCTTRPGL